LFLKKKSNETKQASACFVREKKNTMMERERPIASVSPFFARFRVYFYYHMHLACGDCTHRIRYDSWQNCALSKTGFLVFIFIFGVPFSYKTCSNHQTSILWPVHCVCIFYDFSIVALTGINHVMDERVLTDRRKRNNYARSRTVFIPFCISRARAPGPPLLF
jgi:hypothetical protein